MWLYNVIYVIMVFQAYCRSMKLHVSDGWCRHFVFDGQKDLGWTPLHHAAATGREAVAEILLKGGANVNAAGTRGDLVRTVDGEAICKGRFFVFFFGGKLPEQFTIWFWWFDDWAENVWHVSEFSMEWLRFPLEKVVFNPIGFHPSFDSSRNTAFPGRWACIPELPAVRSKAKMVAHHVGWPKPPKKCSNSKKS